MTDKPDTVIYGLCIRQRSDFRQRAPLNPKKTWFFQTKKDISTTEDPFDAPTYNIPEKPVTFTEGASYNLIILVGIGIAAAAGTRFSARLLEGFKMTARFD